MSSRLDSPRDEEAWLFEGGPAPDADAARIELLLALQRPDESVATRPPARARRSRRSLLLAAAGLGALALGSAFVLSRRPGPSYRVFGPDGERVVRAGERVETGLGGASIRVGELGQVRLEGSSALRLLPTRRGRHRFFLERGALQALIDASPRAFQVGTPAGTSVDLGCLYRLVVDESGAAELWVEIGRVAFEDAASGRNVYVPAGAACTSRPGRGPGSPTWVDSDRSWRAALEELDFAPRPGVAPLRELEKSEDTLGLWHLLGAASEQVRAAAFERLAGLVPPPPGTSREAIVASPDAREGSPAHAARRAWLARMEWYSYDW